MPWWCDEHKQHSIDELCPECEQEKRMPEWKYKTVKLESPISENKLARMGREGWELAGCMSYKGYIDRGIMGAELTTFYTYYFKQARKPRSS